MINNSLNVLLTQIDRFLSLQVITRDIGATSIKFLSLGEVGFGEDIGAFLLVGTSDSFLLIDEFNGKLRLANLFGGAGLPAALPADLH